MLAELSGGQTVSVLNMSHAYSKLELGHESTTSGLYLYNKLPYSISAATVFFQWAMDALQVCLLGTIDKNRLHTDDEDVESVLNDHEHIKCQWPDLKAYLGMLNFYHKLLSTVAELLVPLHGLLRQTVEWQCKESRGSAFIVSEQLFASTEVLLHFNNKTDHAWGCFGEINVCPRRQLLESKDGLWCYFRINMS